MKSKLKVAVAAAAVTALLAACGGDSSGGSTAGTTPSNNAGAPAAIDPSASTQSVYDYILKLIADNGENSTPVDVNGITLAVDETSAPVAFAP